MNASTKTREKPTTWAYEYTDTFGESRNYCWVDRGRVRARTAHGALRAARTALGITGARGRIVGDFGDEVEWRPWGACVSLSVRWDDDA